MPIRDLDILHKGQNHLLPLMISLRKSGTLLRISVLGRKQDSTILFIYFLKLNYLDYLRLAQTFR